MFAESRKEGKVLSPVAFGVLCVVVFVTSNIVRDVTWIPGVWVPQWSQTHLRYASTFLLAVPFIYGSEAAKKRRSRTYTWIFFGTFLIVFVISATLIGLSINPRQRFAAERDQYVRALQGGPPYGTQRTITPAGEPAYTIWQWSQDQAILHDPTDKFDVRSTALDGFEPRRATRLEAQWFRVTRR